MKKISVIVPVKTAEKQLCHLIRRALAGEEIIISINEESYVQLLPYADINDVEQLFGCMKDEIDYVEGWDAPLDGMNN